MKIYIKRTSIASVWICDIPFVLTGNGNYVLPDFGIPGPEHNGIVIDSHDDCYYDIITHFDLEVNKPIELEI